MLKVRPWQLFFVVLVCIAGMLFMLPNFFSRDTLNSNYPSWLPVEQVSLGLDLQGGSHLLLQVELDDLVSEKMQRLVNQVRRELRSLIYSALKPE